jgi:hypothetical protein
MDSRLRGNDNQGHADAENRFRERFYYPGNYNDYSEPFAESSLSETKEFAVQLRTGAV